MYKRIALIGFFLSFFIGIPARVLALSPTPLPLFSFASQHQQAMQMLQRGTPLPIPIFRFGSDLYLPITKPLLHEVIVVDAGHGGMETGAISHGVVEKELNLIVANLTKQQLENLGATVVMTVDETLPITHSLPLAARTVFAERTNASLFVSIHMNYVDSYEVHGTETYYNETIYKEARNPYPFESKKLATSIQRQLVSTLHTKDLGVKENVFYVLRHNTVPSVLVEVGFISNEEEAMRLQNEHFQKETANCIAQGIIAYVQETKTNP